jgi:hypothetical protein
MGAWEPQIRTNLEHASYREQLDDVLRRTPGLRGAALINVRFGEGCYRLAGGEAAPDEELSQLVALTTGLFGSEGAPLPAGFAAAAAEMGSANFAYLALREEAILVHRLEAVGRTLAVTVSSRLNLGACSTLIDTVSREIAAATDGRRIAPFLEKQHDVLAAIAIDDNSGAVADRYSRYGEPSALALDDGFSTAVRSLTSASAAPPSLRFKNRQGDALEIRSAEIATARESFYWSRLPFDPEHLVLLRADRRAVRALLWLALRNTRTETVRLWVDGLLDYGVPSTMEPFPKTQTEFLAIVNQLGQLHENDLLGRLDLGGFANYTIGEGDGMQRCQECIYYLPNGKWCDLPELPVPVEPHWWCRLWKM